MAVFSYSIIFLLILGKCELAYVASNLSFSSTAFPPAEPLQVRKLSGGSANNNSIASNHSFSSTAFPPAEQPLQVRELSGGSANNNNSNWLLILLVCALVIIVVVAAVLQVFCCCCNKKKKKKYPGQDDERNVLLDEPEHIDIVEKKQQPRPLRSDLNEDFYTGVLIPVKQQLQTDLLLDPAEINDGHGAPKGLVNLGNTCYFNATLQCLNHTYTFGTKLYAPQQCGRLTASFKEFLTLMQCEKRPCVDPRYLHSVFCELERRFGDGMQHDSHECLRHFLDVLRKEERTIGSTVGADGKETSLTLVDKLFGGHFMTIYTCCTCGEPYHVCEPFLDISLPVNLPDAAHNRSDSTEGSNLNKAKIKGCETSSDEMSTRDHLYREAAESVVSPLNCRSEDVLQRSQPCPSVDDCLRYFTRRESIADSYLCRSCSKADGLQDQTNSGLKMTSAVKQTMILNPPAILTLHLKRFEQKAGSFVKVNARISYEELLDVSPYTSAWCMRNEKREENIWYALYAVVVHIGSTLKSGHYVAYVKVRNGEDRNLERFVQRNYFDRDMTVDQLIGMMEPWKVEEGQRNPASWKGKAQIGAWYRMCDADVDQVKATEVLNQNAYLLFYERLNSEDV